MVHRRLKKVRMLAAVVLSTILLAGLSGLAGCGGDRGPCVVFVIMDTTRHDRFGYTGHAQARTATLDSLARGGVAFTQAISHVPVTAPSIASILTGELPPAHGVRDNGRYVLNEGLGLLAESFQGAGYRTGGVVSAVPVLGRFGYARGFDVYDDAFDEDEYPIHDPRLAAKQADLRRSERRATAVTDRALAWIERQGSGDPVFLLAHYFDPHQPHDAPPTFVRMHPGRPYDAEISYMDAEIGRLLAGVRAHRGVEADIRVVVVGDHGEGLGQHDEADHGFFLYDSTVRVPLVFSGPRARAGHQVTDQVRTQDLAVTVCDWLDVPAPDTSRGASLLGTLGGGPVPAACDTAYLETFLTQIHYDWSPLMAIRTGSSKWVKAPHAELYDLAADPGETRNLIAEDDGLAAKYESTLEATLKAAHHRFGEVGADLAGRDADLDRRLRSLGYATSEGRRVVVPNFDLMDPKEGNRLFNLRIGQQQHLGLASQANRAGDVAAALAEVEQAQALGQLQGRGALFHAYLLDTLGRPAEAVAVYERALPGEQAARDRAAMRLELVKVLVEMEDAPAARAHWDTLQASPGLPAKIRAEMATLEEAVEALSR